MVGNITALGLAFSLEVFIEEKFGIPTDILYSGIHTPEEVPSCRVRVVPSTTQSISKMRESIEVRYNFELFINQTTYHKLESTRESIVESFLFEEFPYFTEEGQPTDYIFMVDDNVSISPVFSNDLENETSYHNMSLDFSVTTIKHKNKN